jgi:hypothetical protein
MWFGTDAAQCIGMSEANPDNKPNGAETMNKTNCTECKADDSGDLRDYHGRCLGHCKECDAHLMSDGRYAAYCPDCTSDDAVESHLDEMETATYARLNRLGYM